MSHYDYKTSLQIAAKDYPFYAIIMAALLQADTDNLYKLRSVFPQAWEELSKRYHAPGGLLEDERPKPPPPREETR